MGCATALFLARGGMRVVLVERGSLCREASGVNAGTLTLHMTRAALIPYAMRSWELWQSVPQWLGGDVGARKADGLCLAFTESEGELLERRSSVRREAGAPIELITLARAREIEPGLSTDVVLAAYCPIDGFATAYLTGQVFRRALLEAGVKVLEQIPIHSVDSCADGYWLRGATFDGFARRVVLAGGVWLEDMLRWLGVGIPVKCLVNQLVVTERMPPVMRTVLTLANGLLSLKQFTNGTVLIGGGWQGRGDRERGGVEVVPQNLRGNVRLARYALPALARSRVVRIWLGLEAETADAMPLLGAVPGHEDAFVIGSVHSGYTSGPYMASLLAQLILGREPAMPLFDPARLLTSCSAHRTEPT